MRGKEKVLKKVSTVIILSIIIAMGMSFGMHSVNVVESTPGINITEIRITEPEEGFVANESSICIKGILTGTIDNKSIENATLIHNGSDYYNKSNITIYEGKFEYPVILVEGINTFKVMIETNESSSVNVTFSPPSRFAAISVLARPWILIGIIVFISFVFFMIVKRIEKEKKFWRYIFFILWIAYAIITPCGLFFVSSLSYFEKFVFEPDHVIVAIIASISLPPLSVLVLNLLTKKGEKEREEQEQPREEETSYSVNFKVFDEKNKHPISDAKIWVTKAGRTTPDYFGHTDQFGIYECDLKSGTYNYKIDTAEGKYKPISGTFTERDRIIPIPLSERTGNLVVQVKDSEAGNPIRGVIVTVNGRYGTTNEQGKAFFSGVSIGEKRITVGDEKGIYHTEATVEKIKEGSNEISVSLKSRLGIPTDQRSKLNALRNKLQDNYRRVSTYDPCIPFYYKSVVDNLVDFVNGIVGKPMLFVGSKNNFEEIIGHLIDAVDLASHEIIGVMSSKRNLDVYSAAMRLEKAEVGAKPVNFDDSRIVDYIRGAEDFYTYYHTVQSKLFEIDTNITRKTGEMNILPVSGIWRIARMLLNETSTSTAETDSAKKGAMTLVADILLDYAEGMLNDPKIIERLKIMVI